MTRFILAITLFFVVIFAIISFQNKNADSIIIRGSETIFPLFKMVSESYLKNGNNCNFDIKAEGTEFGIAALKRNQAHLAMASRPLNLGEKIYFQEANLKYVEKIVAYDAVAIIVNPHNPVTKLTQQQISGIFSGHIKNWKELGGDDSPIITYSRDPNSGTYHFFNDLFLGKTPPASFVIPVSDNLEIINRVQQNKYAISYLGLGNLNEKVKGVAISMDGKKYITPCHENVQNQIYPVIRPLYFYYLINDQQKVESFVNYILSPKGQEIVLKSNYIPLKNHKGTLVNLFPLLTN